VYPPYTHFGSAVPKIIRAQNGAAASPGIRIYRGATEGRRPCACSRAHTAANAARLNRGVRRTAIRGRRLASIRRDRGLTLTERGFAIWRSGPTIGLWEANGSTPRFGYSDATRCARALRCSLKDLAAPLDAPPPAAPSNWPRIRRRIKLETAAATGKQPPRWLPPYRGENSGARQGCSPRA
jgi:hypothetical protein